MKDKLNHKVWFPIVFVGILFFAGNILQEIDSLISKDTNSLYYYLDFGTLLSIAKCMAYLIFLVELIFYLFIDCYSPQLLVVFVVSFVLQGIGIFQGAIATNMFLVMFLENSVRLIMPLMMFIIIRQTPMNKSIILVAKVAIAFTFLFHGLLALNIFPTPEPFFKMVNHILGFNKMQSVNFLRVFGTLDLFAVVFIFTDTFERIGLIYCTIWGIITAFARLSLAESCLLPHIIFHILPLTLCRIPNGLLPLYLLKLKKRPIA